MSPLSPVLIVCLCAEWCGTCRDYKNAFMAQSSHFTHAHFLWLDIEEHAAWLDDLDIENFPTLFIYQSSQILFYGPLLPHSEHLTRLINAAMHHPVPITHLEEKEKSILYALAQSLVQQLK